MQVQKKIGSLRKYVFEEQKALKTHSTKIMIKQKSEVW